MPNPFFMLNLHINYPTNLTLFPFFPYLFIYIPFCAYRMRMVPLFIQVLSQGQYFFFFLLDIPRAIFSFLKRVKGNENSLLESLITSYN